MNQQEFEKARENEKSLKRAAETLRVSEKDLIKTIDRFMKEIKEMEK